MQNNSVAKKTNQPRSVPIKKLKKKLIDENVVPLKKRKSDFSINMALTALAFLVFAVAVFVYLFFFKSSTELVSDVRPEIIVPDSAPEQTEDEEAVGAATADDGAPQDAVAVDPAPVVEILKVKVLDTPTGFLNVRTGPGIAFGKIGTVSPGDGYVLISENAEQTWYEIQLEGGTGWVIKTYAELE